MTEAPAGPGPLRRSFRWVEMLIVTTAKMARFFREVGLPVQATAAGEPASAAALQRFQEASERYGCWNATPEENAEVGIELAFG